MEEKKLGELSDEELDKVAGGASYSWNMKTSMYEVFDKNGKLVGSYANENDARFATTNLTVNENSTLQVDTLSNHQTARQQSTYQPGTTE